VFPWIASLALAMTARPTKSVPQDREVRTVRELARKPRGAARPLATPRAPRSGLRVTQAFSKA
jgi:hypothetical protein